MIDRILEFAVRQRLLVTLMALILVGVGIWSAIHLPIDAVPDITSVQVQVNTEVPTLAPEEIEKLVTFPIETELSGVPGMTDMRSLSKFGLSQVTLIFSDNTDIYRARQLVSERLQAAAEHIPTGLTPRLAPISTGLGEVFYYTVDYAPGAAGKPQSRKDQLMELKLVQDFVIKPMLRTVTGIADVNTGGGYEKQVVVSPDLQKVSQSGLTVEDIAKVVRQNVENAGGGVVNHGKEQLIVRGVSRVETLEQIANLPVKFAAGIQPLRVKDVAEVKIGTKPRTGAATENGEEAVLGTAMMLAGENSRVVAERVASKLKEIQKVLPEGVIIREQYNRAHLVERTISTVEKNLAEGAILVVIVLLLTLGNWRAALIVAAAIPLSFLFALTGMVESRVSGNLMSLGAIDFGLIIDGAVVVVENILRQLASRQNRLGRILTSQERLETVLAASKQVGKPMFFGVLIITLVYVPILSLSGIEGKMFHPMAITVMFALAGALLLTLTVTPMLSATFLRGRIKHQETFLLSILQRMYARTLQVALRHRWIVAVSSVAVLSLAVFLFRRLGAEFTPKLDEGSFTLMVYRTNSISLDASLDEQLQNDKVVLSRVPEVTRVFSRIGTSEIATDPMPQSDGDFYIFYKPREQWRKDKEGRPISKEELATIITDEINNALPGQSVLVAQPIEMRFNELVEGIRADISVKIFGADYDVLEKIGAEVKELLEKTPGAGEVEFETLGRTPMLQLSVKRDVMAKYNLQAAEVNQAINVAIGGEGVGTLIEGNRRFDIVVRLDDKVRDDLASLTRIPVRVGEHGLLSLGDLAEISQMPTVSPILRDSGQRRSAIMVNLKGRDIESFVREAEQKVKAQIHLPEGYSIEFGGQFENLQEARARLAMVVPGALLLIFALIFMAFGSLGQALIVFTGVPLAATGGVFALVLRGMPFSITAAIGFIALSGVAVLNGVVMVSYINELRRAGKDALEAITEGAVTRLRPVVTTALVASLGFVPMAIATGPGAEVQRPLATVVIGGILTSTFLTLVLLPVLYAWLERAPRTNQA
jgi:cobalt-zinc-cadmium resistance protein CzcA